MNRTKYRVCLISVVLAAVIFGIFYYMYMGSREQTYTDGTFVWRHEEAAA